MPVARLSIQYIATRRLCYRYHCANCVITAMSSQSKSSADIFLPRQHSAHGQDDRVFYGVSCMQGWRISMEDAHANILDLKAGAEEGGPTTETKARISFFGVYDGHGGERVALYTGEELHKIVARQAAFKEGDFEQALKDGFLATDRALLSGKKSRCMHA